MQPTHPEARGRIGACSWSLKARGPRQLVRSLEGIGVSSVQLHLNPLAAGRMSDRTTLECLREAGIEVRSGMFSMVGEDYSSRESIAVTGGVWPDLTWPANRTLAQVNAMIARRLGISLVTFHAGFLPHEAGRERATMIERLRVLVDVFAAEGVRVGFETGQERAETLLEVLAELDRPSAGVNFDPANMLLYDQGDPVEALSALAEHVLQVHVKDALPPESPGEWGTEVRVGTGSVDWPAFFAVLRERAPGVDCMIEREAGMQRLEDMRAARILVERLR